MAASPSPRPPKAQSVGGDPPLSLFLDTDLGTRLALLVAPDNTIRRLKSQVAAEHVAAFPDIGPIAVKSFQVHRKGELYHLSELMTVMSAFTRVKGGCFLHVKMAKVHCCQGAPEIDGRRTSEHHVGVHVEKHVRELPAVIPEVASDDLTHGREVFNKVPDDVLLPPSSKLDTEMKNEAEGLAVDADIDKSSKQTNISPVVEADANEYFLHGARDHDVNVSNKKQIRIEENMSGQMHAVDDISQGKKRKKAKRADSVHTSATDRTITDESDTMDMDKSLIRTPLETNPTHGELSNTSFGQAVNDNIPEDSLPTKDPTTVGKKKKRKVRQLVTSEAVTGQERTHLPTGTAGLTKLGTYASKVELTNRDGRKARSSDLLLSSEPNDESQGGKHVQFGNNAQASTDFTSEQANFDHVHNGDRNRSLGNAIDLTAEAPASGEKIAEGSNGPRDGDEKHEEIKHHKYNEGSHDGGVAETSNMKKDAENTVAVGNRSTTDNIPKEKKCKKVKKVNSFQIAPVDSVGDKEIRRHTENAGKLDKVNTEREILHGPSVGPSSDNVHQGDSNVIGNPNGDGKRKKNRRHQSESIKGTDSNQEPTKSSEHVTDGSSMQHTNSVPPDAQQITQGIVGATAANCNKFDESLDIAATCMIDEVLADLKSRDILTKDLSEDLLTGQIHLDSNPNSLERPALADNNVGNYATLPPKCPEGVHSDATVRSPSHTKPKGKRLKVLPTMVDSCHHSHVMSVENANTEQKEYCTLRFSGNASDLKDVLTGGVVAQDDDRAKSTKKRKRVKKVPSDNGKAAQPLNEQVNQVVIQADLVRGGSGIDTPMETVTKVLQKSKRPSNIRAPKIQETNHSTHTVKDSQDKNAIVITGAHHNEYASEYPTESPVVQKDAATLNSSSPNACKEREKPLRTEPQSQDSAMEVEQDPIADLVHCSAEKSLVSPKISAEAVEPNHCTVVHPASAKINFIDHFSSGKINDRLVSAQTIQNNDDEAIEATNKKNNICRTEPNDLLEFPVEKTSLTDHFGTSEVVVPSAKAENRSREYDNVKSGKEKGKRKRKPNSEGPAADKGNGNNKVRQSASTQQEPEDVAFDHTVDKKLHQGDVDNQNNLSINNDNANVIKQLRTPTSQKKPHAKNSKHGESDLVKSFAISAAASNDTEDTPQIANRYRLTVGKVSKKSYEQANAKSKNESSKVDSGSIFNNAVGDESDDAMDTRGEKAALETSDNSSTSGGSVYDESAVPDDDAALSLSQKNLRGMHIGAILRGSSSYKKAKQRQAELLYDDTEVADSQPADGL